MNNTQPIVISKAENRQTIGKMRIVLLTSDILDGRIVLHELMRSGKNVVGIMYQKSGSVIPAVKNQVKAFLKRVPLRYEHSGIPVHATDDINRERETILKWSPDLIVVAGTRKLNKEIFSIPQRGTINLHTGILPFYRGADSEFWALYDEQKEKIGVTIHFMNEGLDEGDIILTERQTVGPQDDYISLRKKNMRLGAKKIVVAVSLIETGEYFSYHQDPIEARSFRSISSENAEKLSSRGTPRNPSAYKSFGAEVKVREQVVETPSIVGMAGSRVPYPGTFCLRIDADEYHSGLYEDCFSVFRNYADAVTVFFNAASFVSAKDKIVQCRDSGIDVQSHAFYHYTYRDYASNRNNIQKARQFFDDLGIETTGFTAPLGRFYPSLMRALEEEGYVYSSDFAYDYLGLPSYPWMGNLRSRILQIPVFPVAPELFFQDGYTDLNSILNYYKNAIDEMDACGIPVIVYGHTSHYREAAPLFEGIAEYALSKKKLRPVSMTRFYKEWIGGEYLQTKRILKLPSKIFLGEKARVTPLKQIKRFVTQATDFEMITPDEDLRHPLPQKLAKQLLRKFYRSVYPANIR